MFTSLTLGIINLAKASNAFKITKTNTVYLGSNVFCFQSICKPFGAELL